LVTADDGVVVAVVVTVPDEERVWEGVRSDV